MSERYAFVPTSQMVTILADHGWQPVGAAESRTRSEAMQGYQKHEIRFHNPSMTGSALVEKRKASPEIRLVNSHGGGSSFQLWAGILELACLNGLVAWSETMEEVRIRHKGFATEQAELGIGEIVRALPSAMARREQMQTLQLTAGERGGRSLKLQLQLGGAMRFPWSLRAS